MELEEGAIYRVLFDRTGAAGEWSGPWRYQGLAYSGYGADRREPSHLFLDEDAETHRWWLLQPRQIKETELVDQLEDGTGALIVPATGPST